MKTWKFEIWKPAEQTKLQLSRLAETGRRRARLREAAGGSNLSASMNCSEFSNFRLVSARVKSMFVAPRSRFKNVDQSVRVSLACLRFHARTRTRISSVCSGCSSRSTRTSALARGQASSCRYRSSRTFGRFPCTRCYLCGRTR